MLDTSAAFVVLLQHDSLNRHAKAIGNLMCASRPVKDLVLQHCSGLICVDDRTAGTLRRSGESFISWLSKYGWLAKQLHLRVSLFLEPDMDHAVAAALQEAARDPRGPGVLLLQQVEYCAVGYADIYSSTILQQLPASSLTSLDLHFGEQLEDPRGSPGQQGFPGIADSVTRLTSLQHLSLKMPSETDTGPLCQPALAPLASLTSLQLGRIWDYRGLQHLPTQLVQLQLTVQPLVPILIRFEDEEDYQEVMAVQQHQLQLLGECSSMTLPLGHLTRCRQLAISYVKIGDVSDRNLQGQSMCSLHYELQNQDSLPPKLMSLCIRGCTSVEPLLPLQQLGQLQIHMCSAPPTELAQLTSLNALTALKLGFSGTMHLIPWLLGGAAYGVGVLPLVSLVVETSWPRSISNHHLPSTAVEQLGALTSLTNLAMKGVELQGSAVFFSSVLVQLSKLHSLSFCYLKFAQLAHEMTELAGGVQPNADAHSKSQDPDDRISAVVGAVVGLPALTYLSIRGNALDAYDLTRLAAMVGLTALHIADVSPVLRRFESSPAATAATLAPQQTHTIPCDGLSVEQKQELHNSLELEYEGAWQAVLGGLTSLVELHVGMEHWFTDKLLFRVCDLSRLTSLDVWGSRVTQQGLDMLHTNLGGRGVRITPTYAS